MSSTPKIKLLLADVDGTLVDERKELSERNRRAAHRLREAGILFTITSARPPYGLRMLFEPLALELPIGGFNGGRIVDRDLKVLQERLLPPDVARQALALMLEHGLSPWVFVGDEWRIVDSDGPHVPHERHTIQLEPTVVGSFEESLERASKVVGVSDDHAAVLEAEAAAQAAFGERTTAVRSQPYYLDITHKDANKGAMVDYLAHVLDIPNEAIATIGDQPTDLLMFRRSGFSIAMGNAPDEVKREADSVTGTHNDDGFASAVDRLLLGASTP